MRHRKLLTAIGIILAAALTSCGTGTGDELKQEPVTLSVLAGQSTSDAGIEDMINEWMEEEYPDVTLEWECRHTPGQAIWERFPPGAAGK